MSGLLADVFSFGNTAKRKIKGLLDDPMGSITQYINNENDRAGRFNQLTAEAAQEGAQAIKSGKSMVGPKSQQLAGLLADAYNPAGMVVWHGSPHRFTKFDSSKIGTGEGAQAYGHGLYVAESPDVAGEYAKNLSARKAEYKVSDGRTLKFDDDLSIMLDDVVNKGGKLEDWIKLSGDEANDPMLKRASELAKTLVGKKIEQANNPGSIYKIDLPDEHIAKMLDWDKPLSQQPKEVQDVLLNHPDVLDQIQKSEAQRVLLNERSPMRLEKIPSASIPYDASRMAGKDALTAIQQRSGLGVTGGVEQQLRNAGIPGIRYLDGGSRGTGQGTSNFVVFPGNEDLLKILEINGKPVGGLMNEVKGPQAEALETARKNAVKMLGLAENNTPMDRAKALGFDTEAFHGTNRDFPAFSNEMLGAKTGAKSAQRAHFLAKSPEVANTYANTEHVFPLAGRGAPPVYDELLRNKAAWSDFLKADGEAAQWAVLEKHGFNDGSGQVMPLMFRPGKTAVKDYGGMGYRDQTYNDVLKAAKRSKKDSVTFANTYDPGPHQGYNAQTDVYAVFDPSRIRSRFAAFDPARVNENDLLGGVTLPMLGLLSAGGLGAAYLTSDK